MRVKTDARRQAIMDIATKLFGEVGYERASMAMIAARMGGSKTTLYNYFKSKEDLFVAAMIEAVDEQGQEVMDLLDPSQPDVEKLLCRFGEAYMRLVTASNAMAITRTAVAAGHVGGMGAALYARGPKRGWEEVASYLRRLQEKGMLCEGDPYVAAAHLKGMLEAGIIEPLLFGAEPEFESGQAVKLAVAAFLRAYGVGKGD